MKRLISAAGLRRTLPVALAFAFVPLLVACSSANVSGGVSVSSGWYGPWGYDTYWYDTPGTVIVGPPVHPRPRPPGPPGPGPGPGPRPPEPPHPMPMPHPGGGGMHLRR